MGQIRRSTTGCESTNARRSAYAFTVGDVCRQALTEGHPGYRVGSTGDSACIVEGWGRRLSVEVAPCVVVVPMPLARVWR